MRSVIFSGYRPNDTARLGTTVGLEHTHINFLTSLKLNLWDCGGQDTYIDGWLNRRADEIFTGVQLLVYVYDVRGDKFEMSLDENYFRCVSHSALLHPNTDMSSQGLCKRTPALISRYTCDMSSAQDGPYSPRGPGGRL